MLFNKRNIFLAGIVLLFMAAGLLFNLQSFNVPESVEVVERESLYQPPEMPQKLGSGKGMTMAAFQAQQMKMAAEADPYAAKWENIGPTGFGRVMVAKIDPTDENIIYVCPANGGLWKSTDKGSTWKWMFDKDKDGKPMLSQSMGDVAIAPSNNKIIWVGTGGTEAGGGSLTYPGMGVYKSLDGGETWEYKGLPKSYYIGRVTIHPTNPDIVYVAVMGTMFWGNEDRGVYRTKNGGDTWEKIKYVDQYTGCIDVRIYPTDPSRVFACFWKRIRHEYWRDFGGGDAKVWRSDNGGDTWNTVSGLPTSDLGKNTMCISPSNPNVMYIVYENSACQLKGIYRSSDGGMTWQSTGKPPTSIFNYWGYWYGQIRVHPTKSQEIVTFGITAYRSTNGGGSWGSIARGIHVDHHDITWSRQNSNFVIWVNDGGVYKGTSGSGSSFQKIGTQSLSGGGLSIAQCYNIEIASNDNRIRFAALQDNGVVRTASGSTAGRDFTSPIGGDGEMIRMDPADNRYAYGNLQHGAYYRSSNKGASFTSCPTPSGRNSWNSPVGIDSLDGDVYFASNYVYKSRRGGGSFSRISNDLTNGDHSADIYEYGTVYALDALNNVIYAGTDDGNLWVSKNDGGNWIKIYNAEGWVKKVHIDKSDRDGSTAYFCNWTYRWGKDKWKPTVFKTTDFGANWTDITGDLPATVTTIECLVDHHPNRNGWLYLATDWGVYYSGNGGANWEYLGSGLPIIPCNDLVLNKDGYLYVGTYGRGIWRVKLDDLVWTGVNNTLGKTKGGQMLQNYPNPVLTQTDIKFRLNKAGIVKLVIFDLAGREVRTLVHNRTMQANKIHVVTWDRKNNRGARVATGNYICRVLTENTTLAKKIAVK